MRRSRKRLTVVLCVILVWLVCYVSSHFVLSRLSLAELKGRGVPGYYYVPCSMETLFRSDTLRMLHMVLRVYYSPIWYIESDVFEGPRPCGLPPDFGEYELIPQVRFGGSGDTGFREGSGFRGHNTYLLTKERRKSEFQACHESHEWCFRASRIT